MTGVIVQSNNKLFELLNDAGTIELKTNGIVSFSFRNFDDTNNKIIKICFDWDCPYTNLNNIDELFNPDYVLQYNTIETLRGNMINVINSEPNKNIRTLINHEYKLNYNMPSITYKTVIKIYQINGNVTTKYVNFKLNTFDFNENIGDIKLLNTQFIDNDYNYVFVTAETQTGYIINYCLKQLANRGNAKTSKVKINKDISNYGQIVTITNPLIYITTIEGNPIYLI